MCKLIFSRKILQPTLGLLLPACGAVAADAPVAARAADSFVDSIGINVHWAYPEYGAYNNALYNTLKAKLANSGFRHVRDAALGQVYGPSTDLYNSLGIDTTFITGRRVAGAWPAPLDPSQIAAELASLKSSVPLAAIEALEGPNEYDLSHDTRETDWVSKIRTYQQNLYTQAKADPVLKNKPVLGPSLTSETAYDTVGNLGASCDYSVVHAYQFSRHPGIGGWGDNGYGSIGWNINELAHVQAPGKPIMSTESGYRTNPAGAPPSSVAVSEAADAKYTPRMFAEFYRSGFSRTFRYELITCTDENLGLLRPDGTEKPSFGATSNLLNLLSDNTWDPQSHQWTGEGFTPGSLAYSISTSAPDVHSVLLQKRNGDFYLMVWNEVSSFDPWNLTDINNADVAATLNLGTLVLGGAIYTLQADGSMTTAPALINGPAGSQTISLSVPDRVMVIAVSVPEPASIGLVAGMAFVGLLGRGTSARSRGGAPPSARARNACNLKRRRSPL